MQKPIIGITIGDPSGIGCEVVVKALFSSNITKNADFIVICDKNILSMYTSSFPYEILDLKNVDIKSLVMGKPSEDTGKASLEYIMEAFRLIKEKRIDAMVTAPICKAVTRIGHTELLGSLTKRKVGMMFVVDDLRVSLATIHIPLSKVCRMITKKRLYDVIFITNQSLKEYFKIKEPSICILGLNPHSGEGGTMGKEERIINDAIKEANAHGIKASGPYPPDTAFLKKGPDCFVAMYHDQGLIPIKLLGFHKAVNVTMGLNFIRTSPAHGCAFDIAGSNKAKPESMIAAINLAYKLCSGY